VGVDGTTVSVFRVAWLGGMGLCVWGDAMTRSIELIEADMFNIDMGTGPCGAMSRNQTLKYRELQGELSTAKTSLIESLVIERDRAHRKVDTLLRERAGEVWMYEFDKHDDFESLTYPVLMSANQFRELLSEIEDLQSHVEELNE